ncbi:aspartate/glutamate racemase family protein [Xanthomonas prunicola]|uniref:Aspartate/glutamate racemase family protein n=2 Tax=Xanthomonas prunicola TaxID=2053930 RepID=A0A9Q9MUB2_9XANT|nr:aspartate/glutamate racemase family protein [Xanthomonas prunicola]USJ02968.1 aspartate/glutamate racemase family protein [Xanthomonas prunicola]UXA51033.1 aspartate/glutamate racemase family protein [Xanthomonas prunicola]UXA55391.1 aspartate/glutamate racemase family protein [Xanthomonas prunicola]UXA59274.1 aspartate/glutamate racemase family protein [Xanthomonas prunicola]UXA63470.1 aspartate/glutamate racemase family protein [Xanthomonas prunicola]
MSWESTLPYYRHINQTIRRERGGLHSARLLLYSVDFHDIERLQHAGDWEGAGREMAAAARSLHAGGADFIVLCTNTMHCVAGAITAATPLPLLHIADATADALLAAGIARVGLLGTRFTMEQPFYRERLQARSLDVLVPPAEAREALHRVIYDELCRGVIKPESRTYFRQVMADLGQHGAQAIILGCTEISLLVDSTDAQLPLFDTTALHAEAAALASVSG